MEPQCLVHDAEQAGSGSCYPSAGAGRGPHGVPILCSSYQVATGKRWTVYAGRNSIYNAVQGDQYVHQASFWVAVPLRLSSMVAFRSLATGYAP